MIIVYDDQYFMNQALREAELAYEKGEVPVGAVIVSEQKIIARAHNQTQSLNDVTAHAEMLAITAASSHLGGKYLDECTMYVTIEPCVMCAGALRWAQLGKLIYAAGDEKSGFMRFGTELLHPKTKISFGIKNLESEMLMKKFFESRRK